MVMPRGCLHKSHFPFRFRLPNILFVDGLNLSVTLSKPKDSVWTGVTI